MSFRGTLIEAQKLPSFTSSDVPANAGTCVRAMARAKQLTARPISHFFRIFRTADMVPPRERRICSDTTFPGWCALIYRRLPDEIRAKPLRGGGRKHPASSSGARHRAVETQLRFESLGHRLWRLRDRWAQHGVVRHRRLWDDHRGFLHGRPLGFQGSYCARDQGTQLVERRVRGRALANRARESGQQRTGGWVRFSLRQEHRSW